MMEELTGRPLLGSSPLTYTHRDQAIYCMVELAERDMALDGAWSRFKNDPSAHNWNALLELVEPFQAAWYAHSELKALIRQQVRDSIA